MFGQIGDFVETFNGTDFEFWKVTIEDYLYVTDLHLPLSGEKPENMEDCKWKCLDRMALNNIRSTLSKDIVYRTANEKTTAGLMATLTDLYELKPTACNQVHLLRQLFNLKMKEGASAAQHLSKFSAITTKLSYININFEDDVMASMVLSTLPNSWSVLVNTVTLSAGKEKLKYDHVCGTILAEETRRRYSRETSGNTSASNNDSREAQVVVGESPGIIRNENPFDSRGRGFERSSSRSR